MFVPAVVGTGLARSTVSLDGTMLERAVLGPGGGGCVQMQNKGYIHVPGAHRESVRSLPPSRARITGFGPGWCREEEKEDGRRSRGLARVMLLLAAVAPGWGGKSPAHPGMRFGDGAEP